MIAQRMMQWLLALFAASTVMMTPAAHAGIIFDSDKLPPIGGKYVGGGDEFHQFFRFLTLGGLIVEVTEPIHGSFIDITREYLTPGLTPFDPGYMERETFSSSVSFRVAVGGTPFPVFTDSTVSVVTKITLESVDISSGTRHFINQIEQLVVDGMLDGMTIDLREDPNRESKGETTITPSGDGRWVINSFFDVFTELSINGSDFVPSLDKGRVHLVPEPATLTFVAGALGLLAVTGLSRRRGTASGRRPAGAYPGDAAPARL